MLNPELKTPFRWYYSDGTDIEVAYKRQQRFRISSNGQCYYKLYTHFDRLNPFQIFIPASFASFDTMLINQWFIYRCDVSPLDTPTAGQYFDITSSAPMMESKQAYNVGVWHIYKGQQLPIEIPPGFWYSFIVLNDGSYVVSEIFYIPCDENAFDKFTKLEWGNSCDFSRHIYQTGYKNLLYIDADLVKSEPSVEEEGFTNGNGKFFQTSAVYYDNYKLEQMVPEYVLDALMALKMHDNIIITKPYDTYSGLVRNTNVSIAWQEDGYEALVDISFQQEIDLTRTGCCDNVVFSPLQQIDTINDLFRVVPMTGLSTFDYNVLTNDIGYNLTLTGVTSGTTSGITWSLNVGGTVTINKSTSIGTVTPLNIPYSAIDGFGNVDSATLTIRFENPDAIDDVRSVGLLSPGQSLLITNSVLNNDILPIPAGVLPPPPLYVVDNVGIQIAPNGDYIDLYSDGTFTFYKGPIPGGSTFTYVLKNAITNTIVDTASIIILNSD